LILFSLFGCATFDRIKERTRVEVAVAPEELFLREKKGQDELQDQVLRSQKLLAKGDYDGFSRENQKVLSLSGNRPPGDEALLNLGLVLIHPGNPKKDFGKSLSFFMRLLKDFPQSHLAEQAKVWIDILQEKEKLIQTNEKLNQMNQKLNEMIEKSKQIDIEIEERKREKLK
jgi:hypothetical protein